MIHWVSSSSFDAVTYWFDQAYRSASFGDFAAPGASISKRNVCATIYCNFVPPYLICSSCAGERESSSFFHSPGTLRSSQMCSEYLRLRSR